MKRVLTFLAVVLLTTPVFANSYATISAPSLQVCPGAPLTLTAHAHGFVPTAYSWYTQNQNGQWVPVTGQHNATLVVTNPGTYKVKITDG